jgi:hypothetical protein
MPISKRVAPTTTIQILNYLDSHTCRSRSTHESHEPRIQIRGMTERVIASGHRHFHDALLG